jgi:transposase
LLLAHRLADAKIRFSVINPKSSKWFSKMMLAISKTDSVDAQMLSLYGQKMTPPVTELPDEIRYEIKQLRMVRNRIKKDIQAIKNQLHSLKCHPFPSDFAKASLERQLDFANQEMETVSKQINQLSKETWEQQYKLVTSIKGIGPVVATALLEATGGFELFDSPKAFARFAGVCPTMYESGTSVKKRPYMCRTGDPNLRGLLYMAAMSALRYNKPCKIHYERMIAKGKPGMVAMCAVMHKLIRQAFGVIRTQKKFDNDYVHPKREFKQVA